MQKNRSLLSLLLAAAFFLGSVTAFACGPSCASMQGGMACAKACGSMDGPGTAPGAKVLHAACCGQVSGPASQPSAVVPARALQQPLVRASVMIPAVLATQAMVRPGLGRSLDGRGPPSANPYLWSHHPFANAPPISL